MKRFVCFCLCVGFAVFALDATRSLSFAASGYDSEDIASTATVDATVFKEFMSTEVFSPDELDQWFVAQQYDWLPIMPPAEDFILRQPSGQVLPFDWKQFPPEFVKGLTARYLNSVPAYDVTVVEDPKTRQILFFNSKGEQVFALQPVPGYDPLWFLKDYRPELFSGRYTPWYVDYMGQLYDPSRVQAGVTLIPAEYAEYYLYAEDRIAEAASDMAFSSGSGGGVLMMYSGPPVTNIVFTAIERTNGIRVTIAYPYDGSTYPTNCFTNRLDIMTSSDLLESWWDLAATTNVSPSTNWIEWTDTTTTSSWLVVRFYLAGNADLDSDGDGFADAREIFMYHTDPSNSTSKPVSISGSVSYSGIETGVIHVLAVTSADSWSLGNSVSINGPGAYSNNAVAALRDWWFKAFRDVNTNFTWEAWEPSGVYSSSSTYVTSNLTGIDITVQDVPSIWGTISYTGSKTGNVYVLAVPASNSWDTTYSCMIPWVQGEGGMTGGTTYLTFPVGYTITGLPASNYWIRAFIDSDTNEAFTHLEAAGQYTSNSISVSHRVTGINFTLAQDSDSDGLPDWWEWQYGLDPGDNGSGNIDNGPLGDPDDDGTDNLTEYLQGRNPVAGFTGDTDNEIGLIILSPVER